MSKAELDKLIQLAASTVRLRERGRRPIDQALLEIEDSDQEEGGINE
jgi:hypothetical protein